MRGSVSSRAAWLVMWAVTALSLFTTFTQTLYRPGAPYLDFSHLSLGAECLRDACNPYDSAALNRERAVRGEHKPAVWPQAAVYPPGSLLIALPFAEMGWPAGAIWFDLASGLVYTGACLMMILRLRTAFPRAGFAPAALILLVPLLSNPLIATLRFANPALLTVALITLACLLLLHPEHAASRTRQSLAWLLAGLALTLKPQLVAGIFIVLLAKATTRASAIKSGLFSIAVLLAAMLAYRLRLGSFAYLSQLRFNIAASLLPGGPNDFSPANDESFDFLNLQAACSRIPGISRAVVNASAWLMALALAAASWVLARRRAAAGRAPWTLVALAVTVGLLPVYHRGYDRVIALLLAPAAAEMARWSIKAAWAYTGLVCLWVANDTVMEHLLRRWRFKPQNAPEELLFCLLLLGCLWHAGRSGRTQDPPLRSVAA